MSLNKVKRVPRTAEQMKDDKKYVFLAIVALRGGHLPEAEDYANKIGCPTMRDVLETQARTMQYALIREYCIERMARITYFRKLFA